MQYRFKLFYNALQGCRSDERNKSTFRTTGPSSTTVVVSHFNCPNGYLPRALSLGQMTTLHRSRTRFDSDQMTSPGEMSGAFSLSSYAVSGTRLQRCVPGGCTSTLLGFAAVTSSCKV
eukprot:261368-Rhodomonas_salina.1